MTRDYQLSKWDAKVKQFRKEIEAGVFKITFGTNMELLDRIYINWTLFPVSKLYFVWQHFSLPKQEIPAPDIGISPNRWLIFSGGGNISLILK